MTRPTMGATVGADHQMVKKKEYAQHEKYTKWKRVEKPVRGLYIGYRTVAEGMTRYWDPIDGGADFEASKHIEVWLVVQHERHNPVRILPEDCRIGG